MIKKKDRFQVLETYINNKRVIYNDNISLLHMHFEILSNEIYKFECKNDAPVILDIGSNIGISILYFKNLFPKSTIQAFEPDPNTFDILSANIDNWKLNNVVLNNKAVYNRNDYINFYSEGSMMGSIIDFKTAKSTNHKIECIDINDIVKDKIDFCKIDIEGAEVEVIKSLGNKVALIDNLFIEYHSYENSKIDLSTLLGILEENNFRYQLQSSFNRQFPFINKNSIEGMDNLINIFAKKI